MNPGMTHAIIHKERSVLEQKGAAMALDSPADVEQTEDIDRLIDEGLGAAEREDTATARAALRKATRLAPERIDGWLGLAQVVGTFSERRQAYERVLQLEPGNAAAQQGLEDLKTGRVNPHAAAAPTLEPALPVERENRPMPQATEITMCYRHPARETGLRCFQCERPICASCAFTTPVGQVCLECRKARRSPLYNVSAVDALKAAAVGFVAGLVGGFIASLLSNLGFFFFFFILFFIGPAVGEAVMRIITWGTNKRGRIIQAAASIAIIAGVLMMRMFLYIDGLTLLIFLAFAIGTVIQRLK